MPEAIRINQYWCLSSFIRFYRSPFARVPVHLSPRALCHPRPLPSTTPAPHAAPQPWSKAVRKTRLSVLTAGVRAGLESATRQLPQTLRTSFTEA